MMMMKHLKKNNIKKKKKEIKKQVKFPNANERKFKRKKGIMDYINS